MKRFIILFLVCFTLLALCVSADDVIPVLVEDPDPFGLGFVEEEDPYADLSELERLHKGIIKLHEGMTVEELYSYLQIIDESEDRIKTQKLFYIFDLILYNYYETFTVDSLFNAFVSKVDYIDINNMDKTYSDVMSLLDKFSYYLPSERAESFFNPTDLKGVGISTVWHSKSEGYVKDGMYVDMVAVGSSAEKAGIKKGDRLVGINSIDVSGLAFYGVSAVIDEQSKDAQFIEYSFEKFGEEAGIYTYLLERTDITFPEYSVEYYPEKNIFYINIKSFMNDSTGRELSYFIDEAWNMGYRNVILDLQNNSGGVVAVAAEVASKFIVKQEPIFSMGREGNYAYYPFFSMGNGYSFDSVTVLVNESSASSAEILTDTLRKKAGAKVVGSTTYGKGVAQMAMRFIDGSAVGITSYVAYDTNGVTYNEKGIVPDVKKTPKVKKNQLGIDVGCFTACNYTNAISALEERLKVLEYLSPDEVDGVFDEDTSRAIKSLQYNYGLEAVGEMNEDTFNLIVELIRRWENSYSVTQTVLDMVLKR